MYCNSRLIALVSAGRVAAFQISQLIDTKREHRVPIAPLVVPPGLPPDMAAMSPIEVGTYIYDAGRWTWHI